MPAGDESPAQRPFVSFVLFVDAAACPHRDLLRRGGDRERKKNRYHLSTIVAAIGGTGQANAADTASELAFLQSHFAVDGDAGRHGGNDVPLHVGACLRKRPRAASKGA